MPQENTSTQSVTIFRGTLRGDPVSGEDHKVSVYAWFEQSGALTVTVYDSAHWPSSDMKSTISIAPEDVPQVVERLGPSESLDPIQLLAQRIEDGSVPVIDKTSRIETIGIAGWFKANGIRHTLETKFFDN